MEGMEGLLQGTESLDEVEERRGWRIDGRE